MASGESRGRTPAGWDESGIGALYALEDVRAYFVVRAAGGKSAKRPQPVVRAVTKVSGERKAPRATKRNQG